MKQKKNILQKLNLKSWMWIIGIIFLILLTYTKNNPTDFLRILVPILIGSSFVLLGIFASPVIRKPILEKYERENRNVLRDIDGMRERQKHEDLKQQIKTDQEISDLRISLKNSKRTSFQSFVIYSAILFAITLFLTFVDIGSYIQISNLILIVFFFFCGLFYFAKIIGDVFFSLKIMKLD